MLTLNAYLTPTAYPPVSTRLSHKRTSWLPPIPVFDTPSKAPEAHSESSSSINSEYENTDIQGTASPAPTYVSRLVSNHGLLESNSKSPLARNPSLTDTMFNSSSSYCGTLRSSPSSAYSHRSRSTTSSRSSASSHSKRYHYPIPNVPAIPAGYTRLADTDSQSPCPAPSNVVRRIESNIPKRPTTTPEMPPLAFFRYAARTGLLSNNSAHFPLSIRTRDSSMTAFKPDRVGQNLPVTNSPPRMPSFETSSVSSRQTKSSRYVHGRILRGASYEEMRKEQDPFAENQEKYLENKATIERASSRKESRRIVKMRQPGD